MNQATIVGETIREMYPDYHIRQVWDILEIKEKLESKSSSCWGQGWVIKNEDGEKIAYLLETTSPPSLGSKGLLRFCMIEDYLSAVNNSELEILKQQIVVLKAEKAELLQELINVVDALDYRDIMTIKSAREVINHHR